MIKWTLSLPNIASDVFAVSDGRVFINLHNGNGLYAVSAKTGKTLWMQTSDIGNAISVANGIVYTTDGAGAAIVALNEPTGAIIWTSQAGNGESSATPVIINGTIFAGCYNMCAFKLP